ncbi:MAG: hypothetical protein QOK35_2793 [Pseudonocardiales bacterium]|nr:hypothetical protein [Pseudonocardiales bacterium]
MSPSAWLVVHLVAVAALAGVGWVVQLVVYPAFALVAVPGWARYHERHMRAITRVVALPWLVQAVSTAALLVAPGAGGRGAAVALAGLALVTVAATVGAAVPAHGRLAAPPAPADLTVLLRANLARTLAWTGSTVLAAVLL